MAEKKRLNKTTLDGLAATDGKRLVVWDTNTQGFAVRVMPTGAKTLFFQARFNGEVIRLTLGKYTGQAESVEIARRKAQAAALDIAKGIDPRAATKREAGAPTFGDMLTAYVEILEADGKESARAVQNALSLHIEKAFPKLWKKPAAEIDIDDCIAIIGRINDNGSPRQADKLRAYIKAAFTRAINARGNVKAPAILRQMRLSTNPARDIQKVDGSSNANDRALTLSEFRNYWRRVKDLAEPQRSLAMLHILTGGQRMKQLSRVTLADIDRDAMLMVMKDGKGKRSSPRVYGVPLLPEALECIDAVTGSGQFVFSCNGGLTPMNTSYLSDIAAKISNEMAAAGELEGSPFSGKHLRSTIETRLMSKPYRVSSDVLKRLLSHGMGGVQEKHYANDPMIDEQLEALQKLYRMVEGQPEPVAQVIPFNREASA